MEKKLGIKDWAEDDRPREKLLRSGVGSLSNAELLAILIGFLLYRCENMEQI